MFTTKKQTTPPPVHAMIEFNIPAKAEHPVAPLFPSEVYSGFIESQLGGISKSKESKSPIIIALVDKHLFYPIGQMLTNDGWYDQYEPSVHSLGTYTKSMSDKELLLYMTYDMGVYEKMVAWTTLCTLHYKPEMSTMTVYKMSNDLWKVLMLGYVADKNAEGKPFIKAPAHMMMEE